MRPVLLLLALLALAGCQPGGTAGKDEAGAKAAEAKAAEVKAADAKSPDAKSSDAKSSDAKSSDAKTGAMETPNAAAPVKAVVKPVSFDPASSNAESVTGAISLSQIDAAGPNAAPAARLVASNGLTYETSLIPGGAEDAKGVNWSKVFNTAISFDPKAPADVPSVDLHAIAKEDVPAKAAHGGFCGKDKTTFIAMAIPISTPDGLRMSIAAFRGASWPPKDASGLCGVYNYGSPH